MTRRICSLVIVVSIASLLAGCKGSKQEISKPAQDRTLVVAQASDVFGLDPHVQDEAITNSVLINIYDTLVQRQADLSLAPGLAEKWEQPDSLTWLFHLRPGVKFHNGNPLTADDVVFTVERARKHVQVVALVHSITSVKRISDTTVEIKTLMPYSALLNDLSKVFIVSKQYVTQVGDQVFNQKPIGTGRYKCIEWVKADHLTLQANESYWQGVPAIKTVTFKPISNEATRTAALLSGEVQLITDVPVRDVNRIARSEKLQVVSRPSIRTIYLTVDVTRTKTPTIDSSKNPFTDKRVQQAVQMAIDVDAIIKSIMDSHAYRASQGIPKEVAGYVTDIPLVEYNPEQAKKLLIEAGYANGFTVTLDAPNDRYPNDYKVAEAIASQWAKVGINVKLNLMPKAMYFDYIRDGSKTSLSMMGWACTTGDAGAWESNFFYTKNKKRGYGGANKGHYTNAEFDNLLDRADATPNRAERTKYLQQANRVITKDMALIPLYYQEDTYGVSKDLVFTPRADATALGDNIHWR